MLCPNSHAFFSFFLKQNLFVLSQRFRTVKHPIFPWPPVTISWVMPCGVYLSIQHWPGTRSGRSLVAEMGHAETVCSTAWGLWAWGVHTGGLYVRAGFPQLSLLAFGARELSVASFSPLHHRVFSSIPGLCPLMPAGPPPSGCSLRQPKRASHTHCQMSPGGQGVVQNAHCGEPSHRGDGNRSPTFLGRTSRCYKLQVCSPGLFSASKDTLVYSRDWHSAPNILEESEVVS